MAWYEPQIKEYQADGDSLKTLFSRMFSQTLLSKVDSAQVFTHTPLHTGSGGGGWGVGGDGCPAPTAGMQGSGQLLGAPNLLPPSSLAQTSSCWWTAARAGGAPPGFFPMLHRQRAPKSLKRHHPDPPHPKAAAAGFPRPPARLAHRWRHCTPHSCNSHTGTRSGSQNTLRG